MAEDEGDAVALRRSIACKQQHRVPPWIREYQVHSAAYCIGAFVNASLVIQTPFQRPIPDWALGIAETWTVIFERASDLDRPVKTGLVENAYFSLTKASWKMAAEKWRFLFSATTNFQPMCACVVIPFILDVRFVDVPARVKQKEAHTGFIHLPSAVLALIIREIARRIQPLLSLVDREVEEFCTLTN